MNGVEWFILLCFLVGVLIYQVIDHRYPPRCSRCRRDGYYYCIHNDGYRFTWMWNNK